MPLLTKEQQAVLDAEVAAQKEANGGGGSDDESNAAGAASSSGKTGYPKKSTKAKKKGELHIPRAEPAEFGPARGVSPLGEPTLVAAFPQLTCPNAAAGPTNNWGTVMDSTKSPIYAVDKSDPNWDSCDVRSPAISRSQAPPFPPRPLCARAPCCAVHYQTAGVLRRSRIACCGRAADALPRTTSSLAILAGQRRAAACGDTSRRCDCRVQALRDEPVGGVLRVR